MAGFAVGLLVDRLTSSPVFIKIKCGEKSPFRQRDQRRKNRRKLNKSNAKLQSPSPRLRLWENSSSHPPPEFTLGCKLHSKGRHRKGRHGNELMAKETRSIRRQVLPNGLTVITEQMSHIRSVAIGIWLKSGSRDEDSEWNGISHFIEHMVFKGTENRSAEAIARQVDSI